MWLVYNSRILSSGCSQLCLMSHREPPIYLPVGAARALVNTAVVVFFFFFQAEDGIRDLTVTGVQTCALPIWTDTFGQFGFSPQNDPQHNMYVALEQWVEKGSAPTLVIASRLDGQGPAAKVIETRPVCAYPQEAKYKGSGDTSDAANFVCAAPEK